MTEQFKNPALTTHIEEAALLLFLDGELSSSAAECVEKHLGVCSACRHLCEELREAEELCSQFQQSIFVPAPPRNWTGFEERLRAESAKPVAELEPAAERVTWHDCVTRLLKVLRVGVLAPYALSGAVAVFLLGVLFWHSPMRRPSPNEVLVHAEQASLQQKASASLAVYQKLRVTEETTPRVSATVQTWNAQRPERFHESDEDTKDSTALVWNVKAVYGANHLRWNEPLSPEAFHAWADSVAERQETLQEEPLENGERGYRLVARLGPEKATQGNNMIQSMELLVRASDWHAVEARLTTFDHARMHTYEVAELEHKLIPLTQLPGNFFSETSESSAPVADTGIPGMPGSTQSFADLAVNVLERLDRVDALAQDQIVVIRAGREGMQVDGVVRSETRRAEIVSALGALATDPAVKLNLLSAGDPRALGAVPLAHPIKIQTVEVQLRTSGDIAAVRSYLSANRHLSGQELDRAADRFVTDAVEHSTAAQLNAQAFRTIVETGDAVELEVAQPATREKWQAMLARHARASQREVLALDQQLTEVFAHAAPSSVALSGTDTDLRLSSEHLLQMTTDSDRLLWQAFSSNARAAGRIGLTDARFWKMLKEEAQLAAQLAEKIHH